MKRLLYLFLVSILLVSLISCGDNDKEYIYEVPELSLQNYIDLMGNSKEQIIKRYPFAVKDIEPQSTKSNLAINNYYLSSSGSTYVSTYFHFTDNILEKIDFGVFTPDTAENCYLSHCEDINTILDNPYRLGIRTETYNREITIFDSYEKLKEQVAIEDGKLTKPDYYGFGYEINWEYPTKIKKLPVVIPVRVYFSKGKKHPKDENTLSRLIFTIGKNEHSLLDNNHHVD